MDAARTMWSSGAAAVPGLSPVDREAQQLREGVQALRTHIKTKMTSLPAAVRAKMETVLSAGLVALYPTGPEAQERAVMEASAAAELTHLQGQVTELQGYVAVLEAREKEGAVAGEATGKSGASMRAPMAAASSGADSAFKEQVKHLLKVVGERDEELMALRRMHAQLSEEFVSQQEAARLQAQDLDAEVSRLKAQLEVVQRAVKLNRTDASWDALDAQLASANSRVLQLTNDLDTARQQVAHYVDQCKQWEAAYKRLEADARAQLQQYAQQVRTLNQQLSAATSRAGEAEHRARMAEAELAEARERVATLGTRLGDSETSTASAREGPTEAPNPCDATTMIQSPDDGRTIALLCEQLKMKAAEIEELKSVVTQATAALASAREDQEGASREVEQLKLFKRELLDKCNTLVRMRETHAVDRRRMEAEWDAAVAGLEGGIVA